jgi:hypothetical protein
MSAAATPNYWMYETSGVLVPAVERYLRGEPLQSGDIPALRAYVRQWVYASVWHGSEIAGLRELVESITTREELDWWTDQAAIVGIDPW